MRRVPIHDTEALVRRFKTMRDMISVKLYILFIYIIWSISFVISLYILKTNCLPDVQLVTIFCIL